MSDEIKLSEFSADALKEVGNICGSHAANSLSHIINAPVKVTSPRLEIIPVSKFPEFAGGENVPTICLLGKMEGSISGAILLFFPASEVSRFAKVLRKDDSTTAKEIGSAMLSSFSEAVASFFGLSSMPAIKTSLSSGEMHALASSSAAQLGIPSQRLVFLNTRFMLQPNETICRLYMSLTQEDLGKIMNTKAPAALSHEYASFSEMLGIFEKLVNIEAKLDAYIRNSRVPLREKRAFLRSHGDGELSSSRLFKFISAVLSSVGIGNEISISSPQTLVYRFAVKKCNVCKAVSNNSANSCHTTSTALGRFFREALNLANEVKELECRKGGASACVHEVSLEQIDVFSVLPESRDLAVLDAISKGAHTSEDIGKITRLPSADVVDSLEILSRHGILSRSNGGVAITELGQVFITFAQNAPRAAEESTEGWDDVSRLDAAPQKVSAHTAKAPWE